MSAVSSTAGLTLLEHEPRDDADIREVRHWVRVYTSLLEIVDTSTPAALDEELFTRRVDIWRHRLVFWQGRALEAGLAGYRQGSAHRPGDHLPARRDDTGSGN